MILKRFLLFAVITILVLISIYLFMVAKNNRDIPGVYRSEVEKSLEEGVGWLWDSRDRILEKNNAVLWWMLWQSAAITGDARLDTLFKKYKERYLDSKLRNPWSLLFSKDSWMPVRYEQISGYPYYNQYFIFALTCDDELARIPLIQVQNSPEFCGFKLLTPACVTHQLMGMRMLQQKGCTQADGLSETVRILQDKVVTELTWDPRVIDVYIQRILMLADTKATKRIKPVWLKRLIDAQDQDDGSWSGFQRIMPLWNERWLGFTAKGLWYAVPNGDFHASVQGVFALALLLNSTADSDDGLLIHK